MLDTGLDDLILELRDGELTVSERVKNKEGWIQAWMASFWSMGQ